MHNLERIAINLVESPVDRFEPNVVVESNGIDTASQLRTVGSGSVKRYKNYSIGFKLHIIKFAELNRVRKASKTFGPEPKLIRNWRKTKEQLLTESNKVARMIIQKLPSPKHADMQNQLYEWLCERREEGVCINTAMMKIEAKRLVPEFKASNGWFERFIAKKHLSVRRVTTSGRDLPNNVEAIVDKYLETCHESYSVPNFNRITLCNMDQTSIYLDSTNSYTFNPIGDKRIPSITSGNEKTRVSVAFTAAASGNKLKPLILIPRKKPIKNY